MKNIGEYTVRPLAADELLILTELFCYNDIEDMLAENTRSISDGRIDIFALFRDDELLGELHVKYRSSDPEEARENTRAYLFAFRIAERYRGKGLGSMLLGCVLDGLRERGYTEFTIGVEDDNDCARHIYKKLGFDTLLSRRYEEYQGDGYYYNLYLKTVC